MKILDTETKEFLFYVYYKYIKWRSIFKSFDKQYTYLL